MGSAFAVLVWVGLEAAPFEVEAVLGAAADSVLEPVVVATDVGLPVGSAEETDRWGRLIAPPHAHTRLVVVMRPRIEVFINLYLLEKRSLPADGGRGYLRA
jgi:hypothetical protein